MRKLLNIILGIMLAVGVLTAVLFPPQSFAQTNLLLNPSFDQAATGRSNVSGEVPINWEVWTSDPLRSETDEFFSHVRSEPSSWVFKREFNRFTGGGYQIVTVQPSKAYRFTVYAYIWTCNDTGNSCIRADGGYSQPESNGRVRVGIDPTGGRDPNSASVIWSTFISPHPVHPPSQRISFTPISVDARSTGTSMTVFTYFTSDVDMWRQEVYFDDASLVEISPDGVPVVNSAGATVAPPTPAFVPFVVPQAARADGSLVHKVVAGDTIDSILFAYKDYKVTLDDLKQYNNWRFEPEFILIGEEIIILPPGSVDPGTGALLAGGPSSVSNTTTTNSTQQPTAVAANPTATPGTGAATVAPTATAAAPEATAEPGQSSEVVTATPTNTAPITTQPTVAPEEREAVTVIDNFLPTGSIPH